MNKIIILVIFAAMTGIAQPKTAECTLCPTFPCYGSCSMSGCTCVTEPGKSSGQCYGFGYAEEFRKMGWTVSP